MHRPGTGFWKVGLRVRVEEKFEREGEEEEIDKYPQLGFNSEQAVHLIPFILLACFLVLYIFSNAPVEEHFATVGTIIIAGSVPGNDSVKEVKAASILMGRKEEVLQTFSVYSHRSLQQVQKQQQKINKDIPMQEKEANHRLGKGSRQDMRRNRAKKNYFHRKARIIHNN